MATDREERIRQLAHEIWEREGHPHGRDAEHWRMATEAYEAEMAPSRSLDTESADSVEADGAEEIGAAREWTMRTPAVSTPGGAVVHQPPTAETATPGRRRTKAEMEPAAPARRGRKAKPDAALPSPETGEASKRQRRTKAGMATAAVVAGAAVAAGPAVAATMATKTRKRGVKADTPDTSSAAQPAADAARTPARRSRKAAALAEADPAAVTATSGAVLDPSADGSLDAPTGVHPEAELPGKRTAD